MDNDWRLTNQLKYLYAVNLKKTVFDSDLHTHCEFCWAKFGQAIDEQKIGYCTIDKYRWICESCFQDFKDMFNWKID